MHCRRWLLPALLVAGLCGAAPAAQAHETEEVFAGIESECAVRRAVTAIGRLPAVRIVVFDPVSNSFAFVACPDTRKEPDPITVGNRDYLDRRRLALTTQKIRLLVMPYSPFDGDLTLQTTEGTGIEFEEIAGLPPAPTTTPTGGGGTQDGEDEEEEETPEPPDAPGIVAGIGINTALERLATSDIGVDAMLLRVQEERSRDPRNPIDDVVGTLRGRTRRYNSQAEALQKLIHPVRGRGRAIEAALAVMPRELSRSLSHPEGEGRIFSLERDVFLAEIKNEADRRLRMKNARFYRSPFADSPDNDFDADIRALDTSLLELHAELDRLDGILREIEFYLDDLRSLSPASGITQSQINNQAERFERFTAEAREFQDQISGDVEAMLAEVDEMRDQYRYFRQVLTSPAMHIQRFNFPPLAHNQSLTFTFTRPQEVDGKVVPLKVNALILKSAPAYTLRFGTGLVASELEDPTFEAVPLDGAAGNDDGEEDDGEDDGEDDEEPQVNTLVFDDRGNGKVVPGIFLHHYWGYRSPLLRPTPFEMFMPTFSIGIPLTEADLFTQFFLGLDWEIVTGFELNVGVHFGRVNGLLDRDDIGVGKPLPAGVDATAVQEKKFDHEIYFGIVVNRDAFDRLFRKNEED